VEKEVKAAMAISFGGMLYYMALYFLGHREPYVMLTVLAFALIHYLLFRLSQR